MASLYLNLEISRAFAKLNRACVLESQEKVYFYVLLFLIVALSFFSQNLNTYDFTFQAKPSACSFFFHKLLSGMKNVTVNRAFVSYAKDDYKVVKKIIDKCLSFERFQYDKKVHLVKVWWDKDIQPATEWRGNIKDELMDCDVVVCMLSKAFFRSNYILKYELPLILSRYDKDGTGIAILGVYLERCDFHEYGIGEIQITPLNEGRLKGFNGWSPQKTPISYVKSGFKFAVIRSFYNLPWVKDEVPLGFSKNDERLLRLQIVKKKYQEAARKKLTTQRRVERLQDKIEKQGFLSQILHRDALRNWTKFTKRASDLMKWVALVVFLIAVTIILYYVLINPKG